METNQIIITTSALLKKIGLDSQIISITALAGGANNRAYKVTTPAATYLLKNYYQSDIYKRVSADFDFCSFAWNQGMKEVPKPLGFFKKENLAFYEFINGRRLAPFEVEETMIEQALSFFLELNENKELPEAKKIRLAAEACFSFQDHYECVSSRLQKVEAIDQQQPFGKEAWSFVQQKMLPIWHCLKKSTRWNDAQQLTQEERCLSPSDFGFHNALLEEGRLRFFDFEYAGWDDPAKMICDFFCQPELPVAEKYFEAFSKKAVQPFLHPEKTRERAILLLPLYKMKWCCILLNDFLPQHYLRRSFALSPASLLKRKKEQLKKAALMLKQIQC